MYKGFRISVFVFYKVFSAYLFYFGVLEWGISAPGALTSIQNRKEENLLTWTSIVGASCISLKPTELFSRLIFFTQKEEFIMLSIFVVVVVALIAVWKLIGHESSAPLTEAEVNHRVKAILVKLVDEIRVNNLAFGKDAPNFHYIAESYHKYEKKCELLRKSDFAVYGLSSDIKEIALAVCHYKMEVAAVSDYDKNFYDELNSIHKELNSLSKRTHIVRF